MKLSTLDPKSNKIYYACYQDFPDGPNGYSYLTQDESKAENFHKDEIESAKIQFEGFFDRMTFKIID